MGRKTTVNIKDEQEVIDLYLNGESMIFIASRYEGAKHHHIDWILKKNNIPKRSNKVNSRRFHVDHDYFENIDSEEKAYWLGFLAADGYVTGENYIGLALKSDDESHLEKFKKSLNATYQIKRYTIDEKYNASRIVISSNKMLKDLNAHGILHRKSLVLEYPNLSDDMIRHYIRGYFDGDGSITYYEKANTYQFKLLGTKEMLQGILQHIGYENHKLYRRNSESTSNNFYISIGGNKQVLEILSHLYEDSSIYLDRKFDRYMRLKTQSH